ncbi:glycosyltransferase family 2 protein [candidate division KSB1 bacterium]|nr:glycosyltransferase family 2 protein [candidate division KSB1 bacterium]
MKLSIVVPVYNEKNTIEEIVKRIQRTPFEKEIIMVDDYSTDGTREIITNMKSDNIKKVFHEKNQGKGAALRTAFEHISGDVVIVQDADLEYDPREYEKLIDPIVDGRADVVYGSRFLGGPHRVLFFWHYVGNLMLTLFSNMMTNLNLTDMETCYKAFKASAIQGIKIRSNRFGFEPEITAKIARRKVRIYEVPISYSGRDYSEGKKIGWRDGVKAIGAIILYRFID